MASKLLLVGAGGFGRVVLEHAIKQYKCALVDDGQELGAIIDGAEVVGRIRRCISISNYTNKYDFSISSYDKGIKT